MLLPLFGMFVTLIVFAVIYIFSAIVFFKFTKKLRWLLSVGLLIMLIAIFIPSSAITTQIIFRLKTHEGTVKTFSDLTSDTARLNYYVPGNCNDISYLSNPTGNWFSCKLGNNEFESWVNKLGFSPEEAAKCHYLEEKIGQFFNGMKGVRIFQTEIQSNGAGKVAYYNKDKQLLFVCEWYW